MFSKIRTEIALLIGAFGLYLFLWALKSPTRRRVIAALDAEFACGLLDWED